MENYDILIKNCQVLNPDMSVSSTCSVGIKDTWIKKILSCASLSLRDAQMK